MIKKYQMFAIAMLAMLVAAVTTPTHAQTYSVVYNFGSQGVFDAYGSMGAIAQGTDGNLYSTSNLGGGSVFGIFLYATARQSPEGVRYGFCSGTNCPDGTSPASGLTLRPDGHFLGTTTAGGSTSSCYYFTTTPGCGTIFDVTTNGGLTTLHNFTGFDGATPISAPIQGPDGSFYGVASAGGPAFAGRIPPSCGTIYRLTGAGFTLLYQFHLGPCTPVGPLLLGSDGNLYGTTEYGGGTVFRATLNPGKAIKVTYLADFNRSTGIHPNDLIEGNDGNFYGTTLGDGATYFGTIFKMTPTGTVTVLHTFNGESDGLYPNGIMQASDGNFYGTAAAGGSVGGGTLFQLTPAGSFSVLHNFGGICGVDCYDGNSPATIPMQYTNGLLYGDTAFGGNGVGCADHVGCGVFYTWGGNLPPFVSPVPFMGKVGQIVEILGQFLLPFTAVPTVSFNGTPATVKGWSGTSVSVTVPASATSGFVTVTTYNGAQTSTFTSNKKFIVTP